MLSCEPVHIVPPSISINYHICISLQSIRKKIRLKSPSRFHPVVLWRSCGSRSLVQCVLAVKERRRENTVWWETCHCEWCCPMWGCCPPSSISYCLPPTSRPGPSPSLHITQWPETTRPKNLTSSSVFLMNPIFCLEAQGMRTYPSQLGIGWH